MPQKDRETNEREGWMSIGDKPLKGASRAKHSPRRQQNLAVRVSPDRARKNEADSEVKKYIDTGVLSISDFVAFVEAAHREDARHLRGSSKFRAAGRLTYDLLATILNVMPEDEEATTDQATWEAQREGLAEAKLAIIDSDENTNNDTAERFYLSELIAFRQMPYELPFSTLRKLDQWIVGNNLEPLRGVLRAEGSLTLLKRVSQGHGKFETLLEIYSGNPALPLDTDTFFHKHPPKLH